MSEQRPFPDHVYHESNQNMTTNQGHLIENTANSLKAGERGPSLIEDFHLREKITHFDHERIPERIVHARGSGAHGYFECTHPASDITMAAPFQSQGKRTPVFVRFSTVAGSKGSVDTPRDVRGFAIKFYTEVGVWDLVGNNIPVFFIQDAIKFPDLIHAVKPEPHNEMPQAGSAHDTFYDFIINNPEASHMLMWTMSDRALPLSLGSMQGFGVHAFRFVNADGVSVFVKFIWKPTRGMASTTWDEAQKIQGKDNDFHRRDLYDSLATGDAFEYTFGVQVIPDTQEALSSLGFDINDATKLVPEEQYPVRELGRLVLDRNPDNFFCETEQVAFCPAHLVPGIDFSDDPLLQGRLFSYLDTQISRLGTNFAQIPVNRPQCPFANNTRGGKMRVLVDVGQVSYHPNTLNHNQPDITQDPTVAREPFPSVVSGVKTRANPRSFTDHFTQARLFFKSMSTWEQAHIVAGLSFELNNVKSLGVRDAVVNSILINIDYALAKTVARNIGVVVGKEVKLPDVTPSPALSMDVPLTSLQGRRLLAVVSDGTSAECVRAIQSWCSEVGMHMHTTARAITVRLSDQSELRVDKPIRNCGSVDYQCVVVVTGTDTYTTQSTFVKELLCECYLHGKLMMDSTDGAAALSHAGLQVDVENGVLSKTEGGIEVFKDVVGRIHRFTARQRETEEGRLME